MDERSFWTAVALLTAEEPDAAVATLTAELAARPIHEITAFADHLAVVVHAIDTPAHASYVPGGAEAFLAARCAVVAAGRDTYQRVFAAPPEIEAFAAPGAEWLLAVPANAYERATGTAWTHEPPVSVETGSNPLWSPITADDTDEESWLTYGGGLHTVLGTRPAYDATMQVLIAAVDADPRWRRWWSRAGVHTLDLAPYYSDGDAPGVTIRRGRQRVVVDAILDPRGFARTDRTFLCELARTDLLTMLSAVRTALDLGALPPLPRIPDLPDMPDSFAPGQDLPRLDVDDVVRFAEEVGGVDLEELRPVLHMLATDPPL
ncbi:DUF4240 domain-containing protein [Catenuloplanes atrovinosus]|uniref:DUF4240 domain-containing protein n=1 Tax=Catenuloplanes atrovinosus TaxID=137266 RepID=A0AAE3YJY4_9ACTN|nr:DUF4240 domain-containing protein [Catenuloplanes atrovinosus]MDR7273835.1 hypothetical protein [Catenuloplanes atrovinosus]